MSDLCTVKKMNRGFWEACFDDPAYDYRKFIKRDWDPFIHWLHENGVRSILDLGCGYGHWSIVLARAGFIVRAVDYARSAIENLRRWAAEESLPVECEVSEIRDVNYACDFDAVICNSVLDHMLVCDANVAIEKIRCACKKGGVAFVSFDGPAEQDDEFLVLEDGTRQYVAGDFQNMLWRYYTDEEIRSLCRNLTILRFSTRRNGKRDVYLRRQLSIKKLLTSLLL